MLRLIADLALPTQVVDPFSPKCDYFTDRQTNILLSIIAAPSEYSMCIEREVTSLWFATTKIDKIIKLIVNHITYNLSGEYDNYKLNLYKDTTDHLGRAIRMYELSIDGRKYLLEFCTRVDNRVVLSKFARFVLERFPSLEKFFIRYTADVTYEMRLWDSASHYFRYDLLTQVINEAQSISSLAAMKAFVTPNYVKLEDENVYREQEYRKRTRLLR